MQTEADFTQPFEAQVSLPGWVDELPRHVGARHDACDAGEEDAEHREEVEGHGVVQLGAVEGEPGERLHAQLSVGYNKDMDYHGSAGLENGFRGNFNIRFGV